ncbi:RNase H domain-containing protein [Trichonephila clavipes]|nr:RNase H domain-containing protein [Trichonephila clavipes]
MLYFSQSVRDAQNKKPTNYTIAAFLDLYNAFDRELKVIPNDCEIGIIADDIVLWSSGSDTEDLQPLSLRRNACLVKYYSKLSGLGFQNCTSKFVRSWSIHQRLKRGSPFEQVVSGHLAASSIEHLTLSQIIETSEGLDGVYFHVDLSIQVSKQKELPCYLKQHRHPQDTKKTFPFSSDPLPVDPVSCQHYWERNCDSLARAGAGETTTPDAPLTYLELFSKNKAKNKAIWMIPTLHPWYERKYPGETPWFRAAVEIKLRLLVSLVVI